MPYSDDKNWASIYDIMYENKDTRDIEFYVDKAKEANEKVLEIGCGTGRIYLKLLEENIDAYGLDVSESMLKELREKADELNLEPKVFTADMASFEFEEKFSLIIVPFRTFLHNTSQEEQLKTLNNIKSHLTPDGKLILNFYAPDLDIICESFGSKSTRKVTYQGEQYTIEEETRMIDSLNMINEFEKKVYKDGEVVGEESGTNKMIFKDEFELLLDKAGFDEYSVYGGFELNELERTDQEMVWIINQ